jgi:hypothetical protein
MNQQELIDLVKQKKHKVPFCHKCGRGYLLKADEVGYICFDGCSKDPVTPHLSYAVANSKKDRNTD